MTELVYSSEDLTRVNASADAIQGTARAVGPQGSCRIPSSWPAGLSRVPEMIPTRRSW